MGQSGAVGGGLTHWKSEKLQFWVTCWYQGIQILRISVFQIFMVLFSERRIGYSLVSFWKLRCSVVLWKVSKEVRSYSGLEMKIGGGEAGLSFIEIWFKPDFWQKRAPKLGGGGEQRGKKFTEVLKKFLFDLRVACHSNSLIVQILSNSSKKIYVSTRKIFAGNPRKKTVQRHRSNDETPQNSPGDQTPARSIHSLHFWDPKLPIRADFGPE